MIVGEPEVEFISAKISGSVEVGWRDEEERPEGAALGAENVSSHQKSLAR
jgi:hypothetical protein